VTVGREADKVKPNGKKRMNLRPTHLPIALHRIAAARAGRPFQVTGSLVARDLRDAASAPDRRGGG
jgi:hypothetical protein